MVKVARDEAEVIRPRPAALPTGLAAVVSRMPGPVFAVVDGGHFEDVRTDLARAGLTARSLFLGEGERDVELYGPWLVTVRTPADVGTVLALVGDLPAVVFWSCAVGDVALYGHLRRLNMARIPAWAAAGKDGPEPGKEADRGYETVLFRHWDPRVLGVLLPVLDEAQFARIVGPADELCFNTADYGGIRRVVADATWPAASKGILTITPEQLPLVTERRLEARRRRVVRYLRSVTGSDLADRSDQDVYSHVQLTEASARRLGIVTEAGQCRWTYLMYATRGQVETQANLLEEMRSGRQSPDETVAKAMAAALDHMRQLRGGSSAMSSR